MKILVVTPVLFFFLFLILDKHLIKRDDKKTVVSIYFYFFFEKECKMFSVLLFISVHALAAIKRVCLLTSVQVVDPLLCLLSL